MGWGQTKTLIYADMKAIEREIPTVATAAPGAASSAQVVYENQNWFTRVTGTEPQYFQIRDWPMAEGSNFSQDDVTRAANVAVIGNTVRQNLFGATDPIGATIRIGNLPFQVVGVLSAKGQSGMGQDQDDAIMVPITTLQKKITGQDWLQFIMVSAVSQPATYAAQQQITSLLRDRHRIRPGQDDDFFVRNLADIAELADQSSRVMTLLLASIAGVSLIVGGIGIMNIMLVSVTERTREIGIRIAIGATEQDVQRQFLSESVVLSLIGGAIGILVGYRLLHRDHQNPGLGGADFAHGDLRGRDLLHGGGHLLRLLSGEEGREAGPDRSAAVRMRWFSKPFSGWSGRITNGASTS